MVKYIANKDITSSHKTDIVVGVKTLQPITHTLLPHIVIVFYLLYDFQNRDPCILSLLQTWYYSNISNHYRIAAPRQLLCFKSHDAVDCLVLYFTSIFCALSLLFDNVQLPAFVSVLYQDYKSYIPVQMYYSI